MAERSYNSEDVSRLAQEVMHHKQAYYAGKPEISDSAFDKLEEQLRQLAPEHPALSFVGTNPDPSAQKVAHDVPMLSLQKTYKMSELESWRAGRPVVGMYKIDGNSLSLLYEDGVLQLAKTRGNGRVGEMVTDKVRWVADVVPKLDVKGKVEIRGELYCSHDNFMELSDVMAGLGLERPTNPRNIVAGLLGRKSHYDLARFFSLFVFDVLDYDGSLELKTEVEKFAWLEKLGFRLPHPELLESQTQIETFLKEVQDYISSGEMAIDGAVLSFDDISLQGQMGATSHHPRYKMAFKWQGQTATAVIREITWATSRLGVITPVAVIEPLELSRAKITNSTLHNAAHVQAFNVKPGDEIEIVRSGEVIPKFLQVVKAAKGQYQWPVECPSCGGQVEFDDVRLHCTNSLDCPAQNLGIILNWIRCAEIDDLSEKRLTALVESGLVSDISDLYRLTVADFLTLPLTKEKMAQKLFNNINGSRELPLANFLNGLGIGGTGQTTWEKLLTVFPDLKALEQAKESDIAAVDGFAEKTAEQIVVGLRERAPLIKRLLAVGVNPQSDEAGATAAAGEGSLAGMTLVLTGSMSQPRGKLEAAIKAAGGKVTSSVSKNVQAVVAADPEGSSSKLKKARALGVAIWTEDQLQKHF